MKLEKAVELNIESESSLREHKHPDHADAIKIGNEAILREQEYRGDADSRHPWLLPGETP